MEIRVLKYFLAVAREQNISSAAESLHLTQPTLSRQLKDLEDEIGKTLFIRGKRKITLTEDGVLFRKRAEEIIDLVKKTETEFLSSPNDISGEIFIGGGETLGMKFIANVLNSLHTDFPNIHFNVFSGNGDDVCEKLDNGLLDFGVLSEPVDIHKYNYIPEDFALIARYEKRREVSKAEVLECDFTYENNGMLVGVNKEQIIDAVRGRKKCLITASSGTIDFIRQIKAAYGAYVTVIGTYIDDRTLKELFASLPDITEEELRMRMHMGMQIKQFLLSDRKMFDYIVMYGGEDSVFNYD